ncbi:hypothetical protein AB0M39_38325 [Streptomyces sp. NPDC051907]|uniref:hypothetical protein n=1 Tax=Streptomyces sp. NPDC051907 TaxID=3155284 RepID=UPI0034230C5A
MARCGCAAGCSCLVVGSSPVFVSGNGSPGSPFTVGVSYEGKTGCAGIAACVAANLGPGLTYDEATGTIQAFVSRDADNALGFGGDNGLFATAGEGGGGGTTCGLKISNLPPAPEVTGAWAMAGLLNPFNSPYGLEYCIANKIDITHMMCAATGDGAMWVAEYNTGLMSVNRSKIYESKHAKYLDSATVKAMINNPSDVNNPFPAVAASPSRVWQSGWYGWLAPEYQQMLVTDALRIADGKTVCLLDCSDAGEVHNTESVNVQAALRAVRQYCAEDWAFIGVNDLANATTVLNGNVEPMLMINHQGTWNDADLPFTTLQLTAAGVSWVALSHYYADSVFNAYKNAGIHVLMWGASRHVHRTRMETLGIRGFLGHDPVYTRGPSAEFDYRTLDDPWSRRRMGVGQLTHSTDQGNVTGNLPRGFCNVSPTSGAPVAPDGLYIPSRWGEGGGAPSILCGWHCPLKQPNTYTVQLEMLFDQLPVGATGKIGLLFGMPDDRTTFAWNGSDGNPAGMATPQRQGYRVWQRNTGAIGIGVWDATGAFTQLTEVTTPAIAADVWNTYLLTVTPTTITWRRTLGSGTNYTATVTNSLWRGPYFAIEKEELHPENTQYGFYAGYRNLVVGNQG